MRKLEQITPKQWEDVCDFNRGILAEFIENSTELSPHSLKTYESNLKIWFVWVKDNIKNKKQIEIKPLEYKKFQNWLVNRGCSSADANNKRAAISSLNNYIEIYYGDEYPSFRNFINKSIKRPAKKVVREKNPLTKEELHHLIAELEKRGDLQKVAYILFTFETGCRRAASRQLLKNVVDAQPVVKTRVTKDAYGNEVVEKYNVYQTHPIREKGAGEQGKVRRLTFGDGAMQAMKKWLEARGTDDCPYMFVTHYGGTTKQASETTFNTWFANTISEIVGRQIHPHTLRASRATQAVVEDGKNIEAVQQLLGHEDQSTTLNFYVVRPDSDDVGELF